MARHGKFPGIPDGWCSRTTGSDLTPGSKCDKRSFRTVYRKGDLMVTYGCKKGEWKEKGKYSKTVCKGKGKKRRCKKVKVAGNCAGGMRTVAIHKPRSRVTKSKNRAKYKCTAK